MKLILALLFLSIVPSQIFAEEANRFDVIDIPFKEASMLEGFSTIKGVAIHAKIIDKNTQDSYFDENLSSDNIYPVLVRITNDSKRKVVVYSQDSMIKSAGGAYKPLAMQPVIELYQRNATALRSAFNAMGTITTLGMSTIGGEVSEHAKYAAEIQSIKEEIRNLFYKKALHERMLYPGDTISGFLFFDNAKSKETKQLPIQGEVRLNVSLQFMRSLKKYDVETTVVQ